MELKEIVNRDANEPINQDEMLYIIQQYVKIRKGADIDPSVENRFGRFRKMHETSMMINMSNTAIEWLRSNHFKD